jgi:hypothetical protein
MNASTAGSYSAAATQNTSGFWAVNMAAFKAAHTTIGYVQDDYQTPRSRAA